jgi:hypothetical protein
MPDDVNMEQISVIGTIIVGYSGIARKRVRSSIQPETRKE